MGGKDGKVGELEEDGVLIPEGVRPGRVADGEADIHAQHDAQKQLDALKPAGHMMGRLLR